MFDWNDEELANIIWGDGEEGDDHIVPYPNENEEKSLALYSDHVKKEWNKDASNVNRAANEKIAIHVGKLVNVSQYGEVEELPSTGYSMDSWHDLSLSKASKTDRDSMGTETSNHLTGISKKNSTRGDETDQLCIGSEIFQNRENKEGSDFVEYDWANIGSFDDLDRIFSNDDPIFGHGTIGNTDELWSSSKDLAGSPEKTIPLSIASPNLGLGGLKSSSGQLQVKTEYVQDRDQTFSSDYGEINEVSSNATQSLQACLDHVDFSGGKSELLGKEKISLEMVYKNPALNTLLATETVANPNETTEKLFSRVQGHRQRRFPKDRKKSGDKMEARQVQDFSGVWPPVNQFQQFEGHYPVAIGQPCPSPLLSQQKQIHGSIPSSYNQCPSLLLASPVYENMTNQYPTMTALPQFCSGEDGLMKPQIMTPQEKIEKLRRRQQMRAMLAIQKQQQQFTHQGSCSETSDGKKFSHENKMLLMTGGNAEVEDNPSVLPAFEPNSPAEQDDSTVVSTGIDDCSVENAIHYRLQEIISKLDMRIRICIRDSLFRLAQSAMQRQYSSDTSSTNKNRKDDGLAKEEISSYNRFNKIPDSETETNPIDRTVAHLLFHRPLDVPGKLPDTPDSPASTKLPFQRKAASSTSLPLGIMLKSSDNKQSTSESALKNEAQLGNMDITPSH